MTKKSMLLPEEVDPKGTVQNKNSIGIVISHSCGTCPLVKVTADAKNKQEKRTYCDIV
jgi:hypothetical protein